jgi:hypothetical protein
LVQHQRIPAGLRGCSRVYKVNLLLLLYGQSQSRTLSITEAEAVRLEPVCKAQAREEETKKHSREAAAKIFFFSFDNLVNDII